MVSISSWADFKKGEQTRCYICDKMFLLVHYLSVGIFNICFQWDSKLKNIHLFLDSIYLQKPQTSLSSGISKMWSAFFELSILPEILQILFRFQFYEMKPKLSKSKRKCLYLRWFWNPKKCRPQLGSSKIQDCEYFMIINFRILLLNNQRRPSIRLATVMFRGTPCTLARWSS